MKLNQLTATPGATKERKRIGRGYGAGTGKNRRQGPQGPEGPGCHGMRPGFEGGPDAYAEKNPQAGLQQYFRQGDCLHQRGDPEQV